MRKKFVDYSGGMKLSIFILAAVVILALSVATANTTAWIQCSAIAATALAVILLIRITRIGQSATPGDR